MNTGQIIKSKSTERFTVIPNEILQSNILTFGEKGLLCFLLSLPPEWVLYKQNLYDEFQQDTSGSIDRSFKGLQNSGYIISVKAIGGNGKFTGWNHIVYDKPQTVNELADMPKTESRFSRKSENDPLLNTNNIKRTNNNIKTDFDIFWNQYPVKLGKAKSKQKWNKLTEAEKSRIRDTLTAFIAYKPFPEYVHPFPATYLHNRRWEDEIPDKVYAADSNRIKPTDIARYKDLHNH